MKKIVPAFVVSTMLLTAPAAFAVSNDSIDLGHADKAQATAAADVKSTQINTKSEAMSLGNGYIATQIGKAKSAPNAPNWLKNADVSVQFGDGFKPQYSAETLFPIGTETDRTTTFTQFRIGNDLGVGVTTNLGFGKRFLNQDKTAMTGVNLFYDHAWKYGHDRVGAGAEYFQGTAEYRANVYHAISGEKEVDTVNHIFEKALSGYDVEVGTSLPNAPWAKVFIQGYIWDYTYSEDAKGYKLRTELQVTPEVNVEYGYNHDNKGTDGNYGKIMYTFGQKGKSAMFEKGKPVFRSTDKVTVESKRYDKVKRENEIKVETYQKDNAGNVIVQFNKI